MIIRLLDQFQIDRFEVFSGSNQEETIGGGYGVYALGSKRFNAGVTGDQKGNRYT